MKRKNIFRIMLVVLVAVMLTLGYGVYRGVGEGRSVRQIVSDLVPTVQLPFGLGELSGPPLDLVEEESVSESIRKDGRGTYTQPVTEFERPYAQKRDEMIMSRGYGSNDLERIQLRGQVLS